MKIPVIWKSYNPESPAQGYWDQGLVSDLLNNKLWGLSRNCRFLHFPNGFVDHWSEFKDYSQEGSILVIPARSNGEYVDNINSDISKLKWAVLFLTGDEENVFPVEKLKHPKMKVYIMSPREGLDLDKYRVLGTGYPPQIHDYLDGAGVPEKDTNWFFAGQVTHGRRQECAEQLRAMDIKGSLLETEGFTQGLGHKEYYAGLANAKIAPCPSGPETPDTFRLFEALETACVPVADTRVSKGGFSDNYWTFFFGEQPPFPVVAEYTDLPGYIEDQLKLWPANANRVFSWWIRKKRSLAYQLLSDMEELSGEKAGIEGITVVIPVSPIKSHPDTSILEETIDSVRSQLPNSEIILTFDGVREEQEGRRSDYEEFIRRVLWKCNVTYKNVAPFVFDDHQHQTGMMRAVIGDIKTPLLLYVESDTPLTPDMPIKWDNVSRVVRDGQADVVRFHFEAVIPKDHDHMMLGAVQCQFKDNSMTYMRTCQWSQRPHVSSVAYYRRILDAHFTPDAKSFIEDKMHSVAHEAYVRDGINGWNQHKILIYYPSGGNIKRSYHTDGRAGEEKYDYTQVF